MNKNIPTPLGILAILLVIAIIIGISLWLCLEEEIMLPQEETTDWKNCSVDSDCIVFGQDGDCNCGCFNKNYTEWQPGGACFCAAPISCKCIAGKCEGLFEEDETAEWEIYKNEEYGFEIKYPSVLENGEPGCRVSEVEDTIFIGPISLMFFDTQGLTLDEWIDRKISESEEDTKEIQESLKQAGQKNWQEFGSKLLSREEIFVAGEKTIKLSYQFIGAGFDLPVTISVKRGDRIYDFRTNDANLVNEECAAKFGKKPSEAMELMLSTLKFIGEEGTVDWQAYRNEEYGFEFEYPQEWGNITLNSKENNDVYVLESSNEKTDKVFYFKSQNVIIFIEKRELQISCDWEGLFYEQILKILYPDKSMSVIYTTKTPQNCFQLETIGKVNISPDAKYVSFIISGYEWSNSMIINRETGVNILENSSIEFGNPYEDIYWLNENKILVIKSYTSEAYGGGESGLFVSEYNNLEKLYDILPLNFGEYICGSYFYNIYFSGDNKLFFSLSLKETEKQTCSEEKIKKYEYNIDTKELKEI